MWVHPAPKNWRFTNTISGLSNHGLLWYSVIYSPDSKVRCRPGDRVSTLHHYAIQIYDSNDPLHGSSINLVPIRCKCRLISSACTTKCYELLQSGRKHLVSSKLPVSFYSYLSCTDKSIPVTRNNSSTHYPEGSTMGNEVSIDHDSLFTPSSLIPQNSFISCTLLSLLSTSPSIEACVCILHCIW